MVNHIRFSSCSYPGLHYLNAVWLTHWWAYFTCLKYYMLVSLSLHYFSIFNLTLREFWLLFLYYSPHFVCFSTFYLKYCIHFILGYLNGNPWMYLACYLVKAEHVVFFSLDCFVGLTLFKCVLIPPTAIPSALRELFLNSDCFYCDHHLSETL